MTAIFREENKSPLAPQLPSPMQSHCSLPSSAAQLHSSTNKHAHYDVTACLERALRPARHQHTCFEVFVLISLSGNQQLSGGSWRGHRPDAVVTNGCQQPPLTNWRRLTLGRVPMGCKQPPSLSNLSWGCRGWPWEGDGVICARTHHWHCAGKKPTQSTRAHSSGAVEPLPPSHSRP